MYRCRVKSVKIGLWHTPAGQTAENLREADISDGSPGCGLQRGIRTSDGSGDLSGGAEVDATFQRTVRTHITPPARANGCERPWRLAGEKWEKADGAINRQRSPCPVTLSSLRLILSLFNEPGKSGYRLYGVNQSELVS